MSFNTFAECYRISPWCKCNKWIDHVCVGYTRESWLLVLKYVQLFLQRYNFFLLYYALQAHWIFQLLFTISLLVFLGHLLVQWNKPTSCSVIVFSFSLLRRDPFLESGKDPVPGEVTVPRSLDFWGYLHLLTPRGKVVFAFCCVTWLFLYAVVNLWKSPCAWWYCAIDW